MTNTIQITIKEKELFNLLLEVANKYNITIRAVGGWVRDKLLNIPSTDIDIAVDKISGKEFAELVQEKQGHGNISIIEARPDQSKHLETAMLHVCGFDVDFAALRKETYTDTRIPTIEPGTPQEDASRRDLTINALFYNINTNQIEDYVGGVEDLNNLIAKTPIDAEKTFADDPLRILRIIRFCAKYNLKPDSSIVKAANKTNIKAMFLSKISKERIWKEMIGQKIGDTWKTGFLTGNNPDIAMRLVIDFGFIDILFSPHTVTNLNPWNTDQNTPHHDLNILEHTMKAFSYLNNFSFDSIEDKAVINLSMILHDLGKRDPNFIQLHPEGHYQYKGHDLRSVELANIVLNQLSCPNNIKDRVLKMVDNHMRYHHLEDNCKDKPLRKIVKDMGEDWKLLLYHSQADACGKINVAKGMKERYDVFFERTLELLETQNNSVDIKRPINGYDLMSLGINSGPKMGRLLKIIDDKLLENPNLTKEEAINIVMENYGKLD